ncbi:MAG: type II toxin-antitoxin system HicB family antitoxin [Bauldia sp.]
MRYIFPARLESHRGTVIVSFRDLPEAITEGRDRTAALHEAIDCLDTALLFRIKEGAPMPSPSRLRAGEVAVAASPSIAAKAAFVRAFAESGLTRVALAAALGVRETEVRRMLDPDHGTKLDRLNEGMRALGRQFVIVDQPADAA